jgi:phospholipase C
VPPFTAPHSHKPGTGAVSKGMDTRVEFVTLEQEQARHNFPERFDKENSIGLGFRVPLVIASPWSKGGWVNSEVFDHTSTLQFLETFIAKKTGKQVTETNISDWRRTVCGDLTSVFRPYYKEKIPTPEFVPRIAFLEGIHKAQFKSLPADFKLLTPHEIEQANANPYQSPFMPQQEKGIRESCALPYQLYAGGKLSADKKSFEISFEASDKLFGKKTLGAPFNVYAPGKYVQKDDPQQFENARNWAYGLKPGDSITDAWPLAEFENNNYHLRVYGPNGFLREYKGNQADPALDIKCEYQAGLSGNIELKLSNLKSSRPYHVEITDNAYHANNHQQVVSSGASSSIVLNLAKSYGWYDFTLKVTGNSQFEQRYAGRVETGKHSYSDPFMGRVV